MVARFRTTVDGRARCVCNARINDRNAHVSAAVRTQLNLRLRPHPFADVRNTKSLAAKADASAHL